MARSNRGNRGKNLESCVKNYLDDKMKKPSNWYYRFPDARACRGALGKQPADFLLIISGSYALLDPKELSKGKRINIKSRLTQKEKMKRFAMAGGSGYFLIHFIELNIYSVLSVGELYAAIDSSDVKSIHVDDTTHFSSVKDAMDHIVKDMK